MTFITRKFMVNTQGMEKTSEEFVRGDICHPTIGSGIKTNCPW
jgi:hypothetical protein